MKRAVVVLLFLIANAVVSANEQAAHRRHPGSARVSRAGDGVLAIANFNFAVAPRTESSLRRDAATSTRDACATQANRARAL